MTRKPSTRDCDGERCGSSSGTFTWRNGSLISIVSRGKRRGRSSDGIPREATFPASSSAEIASGTPRVRSEEHTSELQSRLHLVCRLLLEKKKKEYAPGSAHP